MAGLVLAGSRAPAAPSVELSGNLRVHDPSSIVRCGDRWWLFHTGPGGRSKSSTNLWHWEAGPAVFSRMPAWVKERVPGHRGDVWAPDILSLNGQYHLYYSVSTWGSPVSAIGLATNPTLDPTDSAYAWTDRGPVICSSATNQFNAIDPAVFRDGDGRLWMAFGSFWSGIQLVELDPTSGKRRDESAAPVRLAWNESIEAPFLTRRGAYYYLFVNWDACCRGVDSTYNIRVGRSAAVTGPYLDREGHDLAVGGGTLVLGTSGRFIGPGHAAVLVDGPSEWFSFHYYDGDDAGRSKLMLRPLGWEEGWPVLR